MITIVRSQTELDAALDANDPNIIIDSPAGVWLTLDHGHVAGVRGESQIGPVKGSATVSGVEGSATVRDVGGSATIHLHDQSTASNIGKYVAVHLHSAQSTTDGGVIIDTSRLDLTDPHTWCEYHGVTVTDGHATVYKAVDSDWHPQSGTQWTYQPGTAVTCDDWSPVAECGNGLHMSPRPVQARGYFPDATRFVECTVTLTDLVPLGGDKCKAPAVVCVREVDEDGQPVGDGDRRCWRCGLPAEALIHTGDHPTNCHPFQGGDAR